MDGSRDFFMSYINKQGWIHGNPVADGWAEAVMHKPLAIQQAQPGKDAS